MLHSSDLHEKENLPSELVFVDVVAEGLALHSWEVSKLPSGERESFLLEQATQKFGLPASSGVLYELRDATCNKTAGQAVRYAVHIPGAGFSLQGLEGKLEEIAALRKAAARDASTIQQLTEKLSQQACINSSPGLKPPAFRGFREKSDDLESEIKELRSRLAKSQAINHEAKTIVSHLKGQLDALAAHVTGTDSAPALHQPLGLTSINLAALSAGPLQLQGELQSRLRTPLNPSARPFLPAASRAASQPSRASSSGSEEAQSTPDQDMKSRSATPSTAPNAPSNTGGVHAPDRPPAFPGGSDDARSGLDPTAPTFRAFGSPLSLAPQAAPPTDHRPVVVGGDVRRLACLAEDSGLAQRGDDKKGEDA